MTNRPTWDEYFMEIALLAAKRSSCLRRQVGAVIVKDKHVLATGYNGPPKGVSACVKPGEESHDNPQDCPKFYDSCHCNTCLRMEMNIPSGERHELCRGLHAEQNAIIQAAYHGISIKDSVIYCSFSPCLICLKMIINAGIKEVIFMEDYDDLYAKAMADEAGLKLRHVGV